MDQKACKIEHKAKSHPDYEITINHYVISFVKDW